MKKAFSWIVNIFLIAVIVIAASYVISTFQSRSNPSYIPSALGFTPLTVLSGSMSPIIETGDMVVVRQNTKDLKQGDIITYRMGNALVTHRIVKISEEGGQEFFTTRGDANNTNDGDMVRHSQIVGRYIFRIPSAGYIRMFLKGIPGILLVLGVILIIAMTAVLNQTTAQVKKAQTAFTRVE